MVVGVVILAGGNAIMALAPWVAVLVGIFLFTLGIWLMLGKHLSCSFLMIV